jgi:hypothetical protein
MNLIPQFINIKTNQEIQKSHLVNEITKCSNEIPCLLN